MNLKRLRNDLGLSQHEFAKLTQIPRYKIQLIEQGLYDPTKSELEAFIKNLNDKGRKLLSSVLEANNE